MLNPCIPCARAGLEPCANCAKGWTSSCLRLDSRVVTGGRSLGYTQGLGGGWAEQVLAHTSMIHALPDGVPDRVASLYEPVSIASHGIIRAAPVDGEPALIVGAGIIGLAALAAMKGLYPDNPVTVLARHEHQAEAATRVRSRSRRAYRPERRALRGARRACRARASSAARPTSC